MRPAPEASKSINAMIGSCDPFETSIQVVTLRWLVTGETVSPVSASWQGVSFLFSNFDPFSDLSANAKWPANQPSHRYQSCS